MLSAKREKGSNRCRIEEAFSSSPLPQDFNSCLLSSSSSSSSRSESLSQSLFRESPFFPSLSLSVLPAFQALFLYKSLSIPEGESKKEGPPSHRNTIFSSSSSPQGLPDTIFFGQTSLRLYVPCIPAFFLVDTKCGKTAFVFLGGGRGGPFFFTEPQIAVARQKLFWGELPYVENRAPALCRKMFHSFHLTMSALCRIFATHVT